MEASSLNQTEAWVIAVLLFILMLFSSFVGKLAGNYIRNKRGKKEKPIETSALTALLFLLLAFTFSMSSDRYDHAEKLLLKKRTVLVQPYCEAICMLIQPEFNSVTILSNM